MFKKELCLEEKLLSYSKYYYMEMSRPDPLAMQILNMGPLPENLVLKIGDRNDLLNPGYLPAEQGYSMLPDGSGYIANYVKMPNVTIEMIDWWFLWHFISPPSVPEGNGNLRYKIWCPDEHWDTGLANQNDLNRYLDPAIPMCERRQGPPCFIDESIDGSGENMLRIDAYSDSLAEFGIDTERLYKPGMGTMIACHMTVGVPLVGVHYYRPLQSGGVELRTRYWFGYVYENGKIRRKTEGPQPVEEIVRAFTLHNMTEYPHLAKFLPLLYAEESWKPLNAY
jgi:phloretin hydrolase